MLQVGDRIKAAVQLRLEMLAPHMGETLELVSLMPVTMYPGSRGRRPLQEHTGTMLGSSGALIMSYAGKPSNSS